VRRPTRLGLFHIRQKDNSHLILARFQFSSTAQSNSPTLRDTASSLSALLSSPHPPCLPRNGTRQPNRSHPHNDYDDVARWAEVCEKVGHSSPAAFRAARSSFTSTSWVWRVFHSKAQPSSVVQVKEIGPTIGHLCRNDQRPRFTIFVICDGFPQFHGHGLSCSLMASSFLIHCLRFLLRLYRAESVSSTGGMLNLPQFHHSWRIYFNHFVFHVYHYARRQHAFSQQGVIELI